MFIFFVGVINRMVYFIKREINGKNYLYAVHSVRLENKKIVKISRIVKKKKVTPALLAFFREKEDKIKQGFAVKRFETSPVFTAEEIAKLEKTKAEFKRIVSKLTRKQLQDLFDRFTVNFTYESNALEGNSLTLKDVAIVLFEKRMIKGKELREIYETRNSRKLVDLILKKKFTVYEKSIIKLHKMLVKDMEIQPGYKQIPNFLVDRKLETAPPEKVSKEMKKLVEWYGKQNKMHPLQKAIHFHAKFEKIHPFEDGNGRVGRFMLNVILANSNYAPLIIRKSQRTAYFKCLEDYDNGYATNLERFLLEKYKNTFEKFFKIYVQYLEKAA